MKNYYFFIFSLVALILVVACNQTDLIACSDVTELAVKKEGSSIKLTWTDPYQTDFDRVIIRVVSNGIKNTYKVDKGEELFLIENADFCYDYEFRVKTEDTSGNQSGGKEITFEKDSASCSSSSSSS